MKPKRLHTGNTLTEDNFNSIIDQLRGLEQREVSVSDNEHWYNEGDDLAGSVVSFQENERGEIVSYTLNIQETTDRTPFTSTDQIRYENEHITEVDTESDFQVIRKDNGNLIDGSRYALNGEGVLTFWEAAPHDETEVLVSGLTYTTRQTYFVARDPHTRKITQISMTPKEDVETLQEQLLHPELVLGNTGDVVEVLRGDGSPYPTGSDVYQSLFLYAFEQSLSYTDTKHFIIDLKQSLIVNRLKFRMRNLYAGDYFSINIWGSNDRASWQQIKRLRNLEWAEQKDENGKFDITMDNAGSFQFVRFQFVHSSVNNTYPYDLEILGYHGQNRDLLTQHKMGNANWVGEEGTGQVENDKMILNTTAFVADGSQYDSPKKIFTGDDISSGKSLRFVEYTSLNIEYKEPTKISRVRFKAYKFLGWVFEYSIDGSTWVEVHREFANYDKEDTNVSVITIDKPVEAKYYRLRMTDKPYNDTALLFSPFVME